MNRTGVYKLVIIISLLTLAAWPLAAFAGDSAAISSLNVPTCMKPGTTSTFSVTVFNNGTTDWSSTPATAPAGCSNPDKCPVRLSYHWAGPMTVANGLRTNLSGTVTPGISQLIPNVQVKASDTYGTEAPMPEGTYTLNLQMVREHVGWMPLEASFPNISISNTCDECNALTICCNHNLAICHGWIAIREKYIIKKRPEPDPRWKQYIDELKGLNDRFLATKNPAERKRLNDQANDLGKKLNESKFKFNGQSLKIQQIHLNQQLQLR